MSWKFFTDKDLEPIIDLLKNKDFSGWFGNNSGGEFLRKFERNFADFCKSKYAFGTASGSTSLYVALRTCGVKEGDYVAVPTYTHIGSVAPIVLAGARPVFIDVNKYGLLDANDLRRRLKSFNHKIKAIIVVHLLGLPCDMKAIKDELNDGIFIVEDASQALGAEYDGQKVGTLGDIAGFSIGGGRTKTICCGEGGMVVTNNDELAEMARNIRNHGDRYMDADYFGFNFRMCDLNASVGLAQMDKLEGWNHIQRDNAHYLIKGLPKYLRYCVHPSNTNSTYYMIGCNYYMTKAPNNVSRENFLQYIKSILPISNMPRQSINLGQTKLISDVKFYKRYRDDGNRFYPMAEWLRDNSIWIDYHRYPRTKEEIDELLETMP